MNFVNILWHGYVLRHGELWRAISSKRPTRAHGVLIECDCGKRWLSRAPWDRQGGFGF